MKTAILTLNGNSNYGNRLQNYALQFYLKKLGVESTTIILNAPQTLWFGFGDYNVSDYNINFKNIAKWALNWRGFRDNYGTYIPENIVRQYKIKLFTDKYINSKRVVSYHDIVDDFDFFLTGSDQVWSPISKILWDKFDLNLFRASKKEFTKQCLKNYFLSFAPKEKRISYAASIGTSSLPLKSKKFFKECFEGMSYISLREESGIDIVKELTDKKAEVHVDPTLLLTKDEWSSIELKPSYLNDNDNYLLSYFLGDLPESVKLVAKENNLKVINLMDKNNFDVYTSRVEEFLYLIHHAKLVVTDSFHACVFSIIFNTPFIAVKRQQARTLNMLTRLETLTSYFGFEDRICDFSNIHLTKDEIFNMDFSNVESILDKQRQRTNEYFAKIFGGK